MVFRVKNLKNEISLEDLACCVFSVFYRFSELLEGVLGEKNFFGDFCLTVDQRHVAY